MIENKINEILKLQTPKFLRCRTQIEFRLVLLSLMEEVFLQIYWLEKHNKNGSIILEDNSSEWLFKA